MLTRKWRRSFLAGGLLAAALLGASLAGAGAGSVLAPPSAARAADACPWLNTVLTPDQRARLLLDASTLDQKLRWLDEQSANNPTQTVFNIGGGQTVTMPPQVPCTPVIQY